MDTEMELLSDGIGGVPVALLVTDAMGDTERDAAMEPLDELETLI